MIEPTELLARLLKTQDTAAHLALLKEAVGRQSITGNEANFAAFLHAEMQLRNLTPQRADFLPGRPNIWGEHKGSGGGPRLLFMGHTDTVHVDGWREQWIGTEREDPFASAEVDGAIWGRGVADLKGGICASLAALDLLQSAGVMLKGDIAYAFIGDEESGQEGTGISAGVDFWTKQVIAGDISQPDFAIYVEPTHLSVYTAQIGFFIADVTITGKSAYFGRPDMGIDALKSTHAVLTSLWQYADELEALKPHDLVGQSSVLVTSLSSGGNIAVPGKSHFSVIGKLLPGHDLDIAVAGFEKAIRSAKVDEGIEITITYPAGRDHHLGGSPVEIDATLTEVHMLQQAIQMATPGKGKIGGAPYWAESPFLINRLNCPTVYCAAGDISVCHTSNEHLNIQEYLAAIRSFALFIANYCGIEKIIDVKQKGAKL